MLLNSLALSFKSLRGGHATAGSLTGKTMEETVRRVLILTILYLIPAIYILQPVITDPDIWWHLQTGKWIVDHWTLPSTDPFSAYGEDKVWVPYSWLFEVGMYGLVSFFGESGIILYTLVGTWMILLLIHWILASRMSNFALVCGLLTISMVILSRLFMPRPWLLSIFFFAITLEVVLLLREGRGSRWLWGLPAIYALWANVHIMFIYGLGLLGLACLEPLLERYLPSVMPSSSLMASSQWKKPIALTTLCALATVLTPHGFALYRLVFELSAQTGMWEYAYEMQAPQFRTIADWMMLLLFALTLIQLGRRKSWSSFDILLVFAAGISAFRGFRDSWFLTLACIAVVVSQRQRLDKNQRSFLSVDRCLLTFIMVAIGTIWIWRYQDFSDAKILQNTAKFYPVNAAAFVQQQAYPGPLFNPFDWGGYLIWKLPQHKVSMDGRANIHGDERIKRTVATWTGRSNWNEDQDLNRAQVIIAQKEIALASILRMDTRFLLVYQDETAAVFIRARPHGCHLTSKPSLYTAQ